MFGYQPLGLGPAPSTMTVLTQPGLTRASLASRPGSPEQWGFGGSLASARPASPYEQWGFSLASAARPPSPEQWGRPPSPDRRRGSSPVRPGSPDPYAYPRPGSPQARRVASVQSRPGSPELRPRSPDPYAYLRPGSPQARRVASVQSHAAPARARPEPSLWKRSFASAPAVRAQPPSPAKATTTELEKRSQCFARPELRLLGVQRVVPRDAASAREARRLAQRRTRYREHVSKDADACQAQGGVLKTMLNSPDEALSPTYKAELRRFRGSFDVEGAEVLEKRLRRRGLAARLRAAGQMALALVTPRSPLRRRAALGAGRARRDPRREAEIFMERQRVGAAALSADGAATSALRHRRRADEAGAQASMRRGGDWLRLEGLRARARAKKPLDAVETKMLRRLESKFDGAVFAAARRRGVREREEAEAAQAERVRAIERRDEEIQLQRRLDRRKRWSSVRRFFGGKRAPRQVPRPGTPDSAMSTFAATAIVAPENPGDLSPLTAAPSYASLSLFEAEGGDGESVQSPFDG